MSLPNPMDLKIGESAPFLDALFTVKRHSRNVWLIRSRNTDRVRWGNVGQIREDMTHIEEFGQLPPEEMNQWH